MFKSFSLRLGDSLKFPDDATAEGNRIHRNHKQRALRKLDSFLNPDGSIDASAMQAEWFPTIRADVFISHSHVDQARAIELAGWLKMRFGLTAFVDSSVWGNSEELIKSIDMKYCYDEKSETFRYDMRNRSTSHVHMMLSVALAKMLDSTECVFFLNTPASLKSVDVVKRLTRGYTRSPWIYSEIAMTSLVRRRPAEEHRRARKLAKAITESIPEMQYKLEMTHLVEVGDDDLIEWQGRATENPSSHALDLLYALAVGRGARDRRE